MIVAVSRQQQHVHERDASARSTDDCQERQIRAVQRCTTQRLHESGILRLHVERWVVFIIVNHYFSPTSLVVQLEQLIRRVCLCVFKIMHGHWSKFIHKMKNIPFK